MRARIDEHSLEIWPADVILPVRIEAEKVLA